MSMIDKNTVSRIMEIADDLTPNEITYTLGNAKNKDEIVARITLKIKLTIDEKAAFVTRVVNSVFDENGDYMSWYVEPMFMITLMQMTTNVPVFKRKIPDKATGKKIDVLDIEKSFDLAKAMNLRGTNNETYQNLIVELQTLISEKIEYRKQQNLSQERQMLSKAREELETGIAMVSAIGDQLKDSLSQLGKAEDIADALKNVDYNRLAAATLANA